MISRFGANLFQILRGYRRRWLPRETEMPQPQQRHAMAGVWALEVTAVDMPTFWKILKINAQYFCPTKEFVLLE